MRLEHGLAFVKCEMENNKEEVVLLGWKTKVLDGYVPEGWKLRHENSGVYTKDNDTGFEGWSGDELLPKGWKYEARACAGICEMKNNKQVNLKYEGSEDDVENKDEENSSSY